MTRNAGAARPIGPCGEQCDTRRLEPGERTEDIDALYRRVFGLAPTDSGMNPRLLVALVRSGGHLVGAFVSDELIGYGLALLARDPVTGEVHHYSQTVAVEAAHRGRGVGRAIKFEQRAASLADGITTMRWAFDPVQARNAHLNLDVLGGQVHRFVRDLYGTAAPGNDAGERTDRCIVTWSLDAPPRAAAPEPAALVPGETRADGDDLLLGVPADWSAYRTAVGPDTAAATRDTIAGAFGLALGDGRVATSCRRVDDVEGSRAQPVDRAPAASRVAGYRFTPVGAA